MKLKMLKMNSETPGTWSFFWPVLFSWVLFLVLMRYVWPYQGIAMGEESVGIAAYVLIHQIPNMMPLIPLVMVPHAIHLFGWDIPAMMLIYHGPWGIYFLTPFIALGGCTLATLRCYAAFMFFFALWGTWRLALLLHGDRTTAFLSTLLLAVCPTVVTTRSMLVTAPDVAASVWTLCFAIMFARERKPGYACAACAAFFAGACTRAWVAGLGVGLLIYGALTWRQVLALLPRERPQRWRLIAGCLACAGVFLLPIIAYNAGHDWPTVKFYASHLIKRASTGNNLNYWTNLQISFSQLARLCDGSKLGVLSREPWHWLYVLPLLLSLAHAAMEVQRRRTLWTVPAMLWIAAIGYLLASAVSPTQQFTMHLVPLAPILCVLMFSWIGAVSKDAKRAAILAMAVLCATQFFGDFYLLRRKNIDFEAIGWAGNSPIVIKVCRWAEEKPRMPIISLSLSFSLAAPYFSQNRIRLIARWPWAGRASDRIPWRKYFFREDRPYFLVENSSIPLFNYLPTLEAAASEFGVRLTKIMTFRDSTGRPEFEMYQVQ